MTDPSELELLQQSVSTLALRVTRVEDECARELRAINEHLRLMTQQNAEILALLRVEASP